MGASVPSTSSRTAERLGSERSGSSASASGAATDTQPMIAGMPRSRTLKLAAIAAAAGLFSGLFGVGGGTVMVPLFILWLGYEEREATGTSLAAIRLIAAVAAAEQGLFGNVLPAHGLLGGGPALFSGLSCPPLPPSIPQPA